MRLRTGVALIGLWAVVATALPGSVSSYQLVRWALGPNSQTAVSAQYTLAEVIGQPVIGRAASATYGACYGYRCGLAAIPSAIVPGHRLIYLPVMVRNVAAASQRDAFEPDDTFTEAHPIAPDGSVQRRNFYPAGDVDWVRLSIGPGTYVIATSLGDSLYPDTIMALYASNGLTQLAFNDDCTGFTRASCLTYTSSVSATLYLKLWPYDATSIGPDSWYGLSVVRQ